MKNLADAVWKQRISASLNNRKKKRDGHRAIPYILLRKKSDYLPRGRSFTVKWRMRGASQAISTPRVIS